MPDPCVHASDRTLDLYANRAEFHAGITGFFQTRDQKHDVEGRPADQRPRNPPRPPTEGRENDRDGAVRRTVRVGVDRVTERVRAR